MLQPLSRAASCSSPAEPQPSDRAFGPTPFRAGGETVVPNGIGTQPSYARSLNSVPLSITRYVSAYLGRQAVEPPHDSQISGDEAFEEDDADYHAARLLDAASMFETRSLDAETWLRVWHRAVGLMPVDVTLAPQLVATFARCGDDFGSARLTTGHRMVERLCDLLFDPQRDPACALTGLALLTAHLTALEEEDPVLRSNLAQSRHPWLTLDAILKLNAMRQPADAEQKRRGLALLDALRTHPGPFPDNPPLAANYLAVLKAARLRLQEAVVTAPT